jgi:hypothetical protein
VGGPLSSVTEVDAAAAIALATSSLPDVVDNAMKDRLVVRQKEEVPVVVPMIRCCCWPAGHTVLARQVCDSSKPKTTPDQGVLDENDESSNMVD